jgi:CubicO group peptidase (beta-lactamase class C family)
MSLVLSVALVVLALPPVELQQQTAEQQRAAFDTVGLANYVASVSLAGQLPEVAVVVVGPDGLIFETHIKTASGATAGAEARARTDDRFYLGAVSEMFTAFAVLRLVDDGLLNLDYPIHDYLPELTLGDPARTQRLTGRHLLGHRSGLPRIGYYNRRLQTRGQFEYATFVREPGQRFDPSSLDYLILGRVVEALSGQRYSAHVSEHVLSPAGMQPLRSLAGTARGERLVDGHSYLFGRPLATRAQVFADGMVPATHISTSAVDLGGFLSLLLDQGRVEGQPLLSTASVDALIPGGGDHTDNGPVDGVAGRWKPVRGAEEPAWYREGVSPGFHAVVALVPQQDLGIVILASRAGGPGPSAALALLSGVVDHAAGQSPRPYFPWERVLHIALFGLVVASILRTFLWYRRWKVMGRPTATAHTPIIIGLLAGEVVLSAALPLGVILGAAKMSIGALLHLYPDLGVAVIIFPISVIPAAVWRTLVHSERWRRGPNPAASQG